jgi:hypothetical protein
MIKFNLELSDTSVKNIGDKACNLYSDIDMPIHKCVELFLRDDLGLDDDDADYFSDSILTRYYELICPI